MLKKTAIFFASSTMLFFCSNNSKNNIKSGSVEDKIQVPLSDSTWQNVSFLQDSFAYYSKISAENSIEIVSLRKKVDTTSKYLKLYRDKCGNWNLNKEQIINILKFSNEIDGQKFHHFYDVLPCHYFGKARINKGLVSFEINGGAFTILHFRDTSIYLGYERGDYKKYFIVGAGIN